MRQLSLPHCQSAYPALTRGVRSKQSLQLIDSLVKPFAAIGISLLSLPLTLFLCASLVSQKHFKSHDSIPTISATGFATTSISYCYREALERIHPAQSILNQTVTG
jgi:hypothetical protein